MPLTPGTCVGPYEVLSALGAGGMGEVYRARDARLNRDVAIKVLPDLFAADPERLARFEREATVLASLNHPHIAAIYGLEDADGVRALVLELVEGETIADRIARGALPLEEALPIAKQIAEALEAAHEQGIIHRDLKPANIKVTPDGVVKVLDFGLAKLAKPAGGGEPAGSAPLSMSPTITSPAMMTGVGMILGTAAYMAPEQAKGREADKRSDIWAFGCVLYEMLAGKRTFNGEDVGDTLAAVLRGEPDWTSLPANVSAKLRELLRRCLEKNRKQRLHDIGDARIEIEELLAAPAGNESMVATRPASRLRERVAWIAASLFALAALAGLFVPREPAAARAVHFEVMPPAKGTFSDDGQAGSDPSPQLAISPDGRQLAFVATTADGKPRLWVRSIDVVAPHVLPGTEGASHPFWSPDSRFIGFFAAAKLKKIDANGGPAQVLCDSPGTRGGTWNRDGVIVFAQFWTDGLYRVSAAGGTPVPVTRIDPARRELWHRWPEFLPDGRHFLYLARSTEPGQDGIYAGALDSAETSRVLSANSRVAFATPGYLFFVRQGTLLAQSFDARMLRLSGDAVPVGEHVAAYAGTGEAAFSPSASGLAYADGVAIPPSQLTWFDRAGRPIETISTPARNKNLALSRDEKRVAVQRANVDTGIDDVWVVDLVRGATSRLTSGSTQKRSPVWSPDGSRIVFASYAGTTDLYQKNASGAGSDDLLLKTGATGALPTDWSSDGRSLVYAAAGSKTSYDLWVLPLAGKRTPIPFLQTIFIETQGQLSPDGRWMAYSSDETGTREVWVQPFPATGAKWQVSTEGGSEPKWRGDGSEMFYVAGAGTLMAVPINVAATTFEAGVPVPLFETRRPFSGPLVSNYIPAADGQRFLVNTIATERSPSPITVVLNWTTTLKQ